MDHDTYPESYIRDILTGARAFALVGASANPVRPSFFVLKYLLAKGYRVHPVNPGLAGSDILHQPVFARLGDVPGLVDVVDIFRNSQATLDTTREAIAQKERLGLKAIWMQLGVRNDEAARLAEDAGLKVVMNRCPKIEYGRLSGEIGWAGVNSRLLSSQKPRMGARGIQNFTLGKR